jgi:DNA gyrase/topoisomerase IV subunit A
MDTNLQGNIGESKVMLHYISEKYSVYLPFGTASKNDMIVEKDGIIKRISVKSTRTKSKSGKYIVKIRQGKLNKQVAFDKNGSDILCVYIVPEDRIVFINSQDITAGFEISVK